MPERNAAHVTAHKFPALVHSGLAATVAASKKRASDLCRERTETACGSHSARSNWLFWLAPCGSVARPMITSCRRPCSRHFCRAWHWSRTREGTCCNGSASGSCRCRTTWGTAAVRSSCVPHFAPCGISDGDGRAVRLQARLVVVLPVVVGTADDAAWHAWCEVCSPTSTPAAAVVISDDDDEDEDGKSEQQQQQPSAGGGRCVHVNPVTVAVDEPLCESRTVDGKVLALPYVVSVDHTGSVQDVTARYSAQYAKNVKKWLRGASETWWQGVLTDLRSASASASSSSSSSSASSSSSSSSSSLSSSCCCSG